MKTIFAIFCLVCSVVAQSGDSESFYTVDPFNTPELNQDFADFVNLLPVDTVLDIVDDHYENNAGINKTLNYLKTNKFAKHWDNLFSLREVHNFVVYLNESGLNVFGVLNEFAEYFELTPVGFVLVEDAPEEKIEYTWGFNALVNDVIDVLPKDDLKALFDQKVANGEDFANFVECFSTSEFKEVLKKLELSPVAQKLFKRFRKHGLDVHKLVQLALAVFGLN